MRGRRAKLAALAAEYSHKAWRDRPRMMKYTSETHHLKRLVADKWVEFTGRSTHCIPMRKKYKAFKAFIKARRCAPHARSMGNGYIIYRLWGEKAFKRYVWKCRAKKVTA